jgi:hypothetical protein
MSLVSLSLVVLAAFIHATWNLLSKRAADAGPTFVFAYNLFACLVYLPWMIWLLVYGDLHWNLPVAGCLVLSAVIHLAYSLCLQRGYQVADLSVVYPIARGTGPLLSAHSLFCRKHRARRASLDCSRSSPGSASSPRKAISPRSDGRVASTACAGAPRRDH